MLAIFRRSIAPLAVAAALAASAPISLRAEKVMAPGPTTAGSTLLEKADAPTQSREAKLEREEVEGRHERPILDPEWQEALWILITFVILLAVLYPTAWKNVVAGLKARENRIRKDIADAEAARLKAEESLKQYNVQLGTAEGQVRQMIESARVDAQRIADGIREQAGRDAEATRQRALKDIEDARRQALSEIYEQTAALATNVAEKILRRNLNPDDQRDLVSQSLEQFQSVGR